MTRLQPAARRRRRSGRLGQDRAGRRAVQAAARPLRHRRRHQRHLHEGGRRVPDAQRGAAARSGSSASRPAAARTPRSARTRRSTSTRSTACSRKFPTLDLVLHRERRRQPGRDLQPRAGRPDDLRDRRRRAATRSRARAARASPRSDLLVINKTDLAPHVGATLEVMDRDARKMRGERPFVFTCVRRGDGIDAVAAFVVREGLLEA